MQTKLQIKKEIPVQGSSFFVQIFQLLSNYLSVNEYISVNEDISVSDIKFYSALVAFAAFFLACSWRALVLPSGLISPAFKSAIFVNAGPMSS